MIGSDAVERRRVSRIIGDHAILAVVEIADPKAAGELAAVLGAAGIAALEITLRTEAAIDAVYAAVEVNALPVGAGTVTNTQKAQAAVDAGAKFLVSPIHSKSVAEFCANSDIALLPGVVTPTEVHLAQSDGFGELKLFPASNFGGIVLVRSLAAVFPDMSFVPTGGVNHERALEYLAHKSVVGVGGSWIATAELIDQQNWAEIDRRARAIVSQLASLAQ